MYHLRTVLKFLIYSAFLFVSCHDHGQVIRISEDIKEPKNELINTLEKLVNDDGQDHLKLEVVSNSIPHIDSLISGQYDLMVVDNNIKYDKDVSLLSPLYSQILHVLHKNNFQPSSIYDLLENKKIYAGEAGSGSHQLLLDLLEDLQIPARSVEILDVINLFDADVIILFTGLISIQELVDLEDYSFYSLDSADELGLGTIAEAISLRHPQFRPFILPSYIYGNRTREPILTISNQTILVCRTDEDPDMIYELSKLIYTKKQMLYKISPLLQQVFNNKNDVGNNILPLHEGARRFLERDKPGFIESNSGLIGIVITLLVAVMSSLYTYLNFRAIRKKNIIDLYFAKLIDIRTKINDLDSIEEVEQYLLQIKLMLNETIDLVIKEKLSANESYLVFMRLGDLVTAELKEKLKSLS